MSEEAVHAPAENITLAHHEQHSQTRYEKLCQKLKSLKESKMSEGGGMGGLGAAAVISAMGNRNEAGGLSTLVPALMAGHGGMGGMAGGFGAGLLGGVLGGALLGGRRGGLFGGGDCDGNGAETRIEDTVFNAAVLSKLGSIEAAVPLAAAQTESVILNQTNAIQNIASQSQLFNAAGFASNKDTVQNLALVLSQAICGVQQNVSAQGCQTREAVSTDGDRTRALINSINDAAQNRMLASQAAEIIELRNEHRRSADTAELRQSITVNNTATNAQQQGQIQAQAQLQFQDIGNQLRRVCEALSVVHQEQRSTNANIIAGNTGAVVTGAQTSTPTNVNAR